MRKPRNEERLQVLVDGLWQHAVVAICLSKQFTYRLDSRASHTDFMFYDSPEWRLLDA